MAPLGQVSLQEPQSRQAAADDIGVVALADGTGGAGVRARAAAHAGRSNLIGHGKHLH